MTMTISPMQPEYVTRKEFYDLKSYIDEGFEATNGHIDVLEENMNHRFTSLEKKMDKRFFSVEDQLTTLNAVVNKIAAKIL